MTTGTLEGLLAGSAETAPTFACAGIYEYMPRLGLSPPRGRTFLAEIRRYIKKGKDCKERIVAAKPSASLRFPDPGTRVPGKWVPNNRGYKETNLRLCASPGYPRASPLYTQKGTHLHTLRPR